MAITREPWVTTWGVPYGEALNIAAVEYDDNDYSPAQVATVIGDSIVATYLQWLGTYCTLTRVQIGDDTSGGFATYSDNGNDVDASPNPSVSYMITKVVTGARNGRWFLPGVTEGAVDALGKIAVTKQVALQTSFDSHLLDLTGADIVPQVVGAPAVPGGLPTYTPIDRLLVRDYMGYLSGRLDRGRY